MTYRFAATNKEDMKRWYDKLRRLSNVVLLRFSRDYCMGRLLKRASYIKTQLATNNETGATCVVKSFLKAILFESRSALVPTLVTTDGSAIWSTKYRCRDASTIPG